MRLSVLLMRAAATTKGESVATAGRASCWGGRAAAITAQNGLPQGAHKAVVVCAVGEVQRHNVAKAQRRIVALAAHCGSWPIGKGRMRAGLRGGAAARSVARGMRACAAGCVSTSAGSAGKESSEGERKEAGRVCTVAFLLLSAGFPCARGKRLAAAGKGGCVRGCCSLCVASAARKANLRRCIQGQGGKEEKRGDAASQEEEASRGERGAAG